MCQMTIENLKTGLTVDYGKPLFAQRLVNFTCDHMSEMDSLLLPQILNENTHS